MLNVDKLKPFVGAYLRSFFGHFSSNKKWEFERPNLRTESKNLVKHPPKWWIRHLIHAFPFQGGIKPNLKNRIFPIVLELFFPSTEQNQKMACKKSLWSIMLNICLWSLLTQWHRMSRNKDKNFEKIICGQISQTNSRI